MYYIFLDYELKGEKINTLTVKLPLSVNDKQDIGKRREVIKHFCSHINHFTLVCRHPTIYTSRLEMMLEEIKSMRFKNIVLIFACQKSSILTPKYKISSNHDIYATNLFLINYKNIQYGGVNLSQHWGLNPSVLGDCKLF